ncbi:zinc ribbon domain-containing protein [Oligoflexia bacterium]|nr:zinc ribbon domain-containing protein [Oligoflexia bacterium]
MPIYEYNCPECGRFECMQRISDDPLRECPTCVSKGLHSKIERLVSASTFHLKGTGWYKTDYASSGASGGTSNGNGNGNGNGSSAHSVDTKADASNGNGAGKNGSSPAKSDTTTSDTSKSKSERSPKASSGNQSSTEK